jgi:hypothetical protein
MEKKPGSAASRRGMGNSHMSARSPRATRCACSKKSPRPHDALACLQPRRWSVAMQQVVQAFGCLVFCRRQASPIMGRFRLDGGESSPASPKSDGLDVRKLLRMLMRCAHGERQRAGPCHPYLCGQ